MAENPGKQPPKRGPICKISPSDSCGRDTVLLAVEQWYGFPEFGGHLGNVGLDVTNFETITRERFHCWRNRPGRRTTVCYGRPGRGRAGAIPR